MLLHVVCAPHMFMSLFAAGELNHSRLQVLLGSIADDELTTLEQRAAVSPRKWRTQHGSSACGAGSGWLA